ncbi:MAG: aromatic-ring-hydroxylating dioxygenase subunit beta [Pigmentiphaga sp.]
MEIDFQEKATQLLYREAYYLDCRRWSDWAMLYAEDCEFWVPAWRSDTEVTSNPEEEVSLIYIRSRQGLIERAERVSSGRSVASFPPQRTAHTVGNILVDTDGSGPGKVMVRSVWNVHVYNPKRKLQDVFFTLCEHCLEAVGGDLLITRRKALLQNDCLPTMLDFYSV